MLQPKHRPDGWRLACLALAASLAAAACGQGGAANPAATALPAADAPEAPATAATTSVVQIPAPTAAPIVIGALFPLDGNAAALAGEERTGVEIARDLVNVDGGVSGRSIQLDVRNLDRADTAPSVVGSLEAEGVQVIIGSYSSDLSVPASQAVSDAGLVYWESGAVADRLTGRGLPGVFRVGASGRTLGENSARFAAHELAPRLGEAPADLRIAIVAADDDYARSVADAAQSDAAKDGLDLVGRLTYDLLRPDWPGLISSLAALRPDILILSSHVEDGVAFRRAMLAAGLHVGAFIGSTMAQCGPEWGAELGDDAIGTFASDRPPGGFDPDALTGDARATYDRFAAEWSQRTGFAGDPSEEALAGFSAAWPLFHDALPAAAAMDADLAARAIDAAARTIDLPDGSLPNGAGLRFSDGPDDLGQNLRAAGVVWQWQALRTSVTVWPAAYATGEIGFVPLPR